MASWNVDLSTIPDLIEDEAREFVLERVFDYQSTVTFLTPVDTGRLRGGWHVSYGAPSSAVENAPDAAPGSFKMGMTAYVQNNVHYGVFVNDGTRFQRGQHFMERTIQTVG